MSDTNMRVLVVYYSRTGHTRKLAEAILQTTGWDVDVIVDTRDRHGIRGYLRAGFESLTGRRTQLAPPLKSPTGYDLVVLGSPVWVGRASVPMRSYLMDHARELPRVAFFATLGGHGSERAFAQMSELAGKAPLATLALRERELGHADAVSQTFIAEIERAWRQRPAGPPAAHERAPAALHPV